MKRVFKPLILICLILAMLVCSASCGELEVIEKSELGLNFVIPKDFEQTYTYYADIEYGNGETAFFADLMPYSELELDSNATVQECTEKVIDNMSFGGVQIIYDTAKNTAQFDTWASDEEGTESYYNYVVILLGKSGIYIARYVCPGTEKEIKRNTEDFAEMAARLSVR